MTANPHPVQAICNTDETTQALVGFLMARCGVDSYNAVKPFARGATTIVIGKRYADVFEHLTGLAAKHGATQNGTMYLDDVRKLLQVPGLVPQYERYISTLCTPVIKPDYNIHSVTTTDQLAEVLDGLDPSLPIAFDIETNGLYWQADNPKILCLVMAQRLNDTWHTVCIDGALLHDTDSRIARDTLQAFFDACVCLIAHNASFDVSWLQQVLGITVVCHFDTMLMAFSEHLSVLRYSNGLKQLTERYFNVPDYSKSIKPYTTGKNAGRGYENVPYDLLSVYAVKDVVYTWLLYDRMVKPSFGWYHTYRALYHNRVDIYTALNQRGIGIDWGAVQQYQDWLTEISSRHLRAIRQQAGYALNPNSPKQLQTYLYDTLGLTKQYGKNRKATTNNAALQALIAANPDLPVLTLLGQYRKVNKVLGTYLAGIERLSNRSADRMHENYKLTATISGRIGSEVLLLLPRASSIWGQLVKSCFVAKPGHTFIQADVSQLEVRVMAYLSQDTKLIQAYQQGLDIHGQTAQSIYGDGYTKAQRTLAKGATFSNAYGGDWRTLMRNNNMTSDAAKELYYSYLATYTGVAAWIDQTHSAALEYGCVVNEMGRKLDLGLISDRNIASIKRLAQNWMIQSFGSDVVMLAVHEMVSQGVPVVLTVHDSVIAEVPTDQYEHYKDIIVNTMQRVGNYWLRPTQQYPQAVPFVVDVDDPVIRLAHPCDWQDLTNSLLYDELWQAMVDEDTSDAN